MLQQSERLPVRPPMRAPAADPPIPVDSELVALVRAGAAGDPDAFACLVGRFDRALRGVARSCRLSSWDADDVIQATWLQFLQHGRELREPHAVSGWLVTTARRQSLAVLRRRVREPLSNDPTRGEPSDLSEPDHELIAAERRQLLRDGLAELPERQRDLMMMLLTSSELSYEEVGRRLAMPVGSIGPTRARSLERLRRDSRLRALQAAGA